MFAVPGWNITAPIATQVEQPKPKDPNKLGKKAQKRKEKQELQVNAENIGEYWDKVVDKKIDKQSDSIALKQDGTEPAGEDAQEQRGKKRKRGKRKKAENEAETGETEAGQNAQPVANESQPPPKPADTDSKREKKKRKKDDKPDLANSTLQPLAKDTVPVSLIPEPAGLTPLQKSMRTKLASARFRHLNESLYTKPSAESLDLFKDDPSMFEDYHRGFAQQVEVWPENPVDSYVNSILARGKIRNRDPWKDKKRKDKGKKGGKEAQEIVPESDTGVRATGDAKPLPRNFKGHATIADLGCGTASLSYRLQPHLKDLNTTLHSFDLSKPSGPSGPLVTVADISSLPLPDGSVDVAIFCLALMGTNWLDFIDEAYRILRWRGELWISEIKSRFGRVDKKKNAIPINSIGSLKKDMPKKPAKGKKKSDKPEEEGIAGSEDEAELAERVDGVDAKEGTDVSAFVEALKKRGFVLDALPEKPGDAIDLSNKMFVKMQFVKAAPPSKGKNVKRDADGKPVGADRAGQKGVKFGMKGKKFAAVKEDEGEDDGSENKVLKPCLYKIR